jgi:O-methyltransferase
MRFSIDEVNSDRVLGWVFDPRRRPEVSVEVDGRPVGRAQTGGYRSDVAKSLGDEHAAASGFEFRFGPGDFGHVSGRRAEIVVRLGDVVTPPTAVPVLAGRATPGARAGRIGPLPPEALDLLAAYSSDYDAPDWSDDATMGQAVADLRFLVERGPRAVPGVHRHLLLLAALWVRAVLVERYFPRENQNASLDDKDRSALQNSAIEVFCVGAHLATLSAHGVPGRFVEFGCFKGFSTAILSYGCHQLGMAMDVFDSFAGLPPSTSAYYRAGDFRGSRAEVEANVATYGSHQPVTYHEGFFADSIPAFAEKQVCCIWMDVDLESSSRDAMAILPRLDRCGAVFSHEAPAEIFGGGTISAIRAPEAVVPPIVDAFAAAGRPLAGRHIYGNTGAFWDSERGISPLSTEGLLSLRDLALTL